MTLALEIDSQLAAALITAVATILAALIPIVVAVRSRRRTKRSRRAAGPDAPRTPTKGPDNPWMSVDYGRLRSWSDGQRPRILIVFVHGVMSDAERAWGRLPELLAERRGDAARFDALSFGYPAKLLHRSDIRRAAERLRHAIVETYSEYDDYIFVTHSTGGLVVKLAMLELLEPIVEQLSDSRGEESRTMSVDSSRAFRVRRIVNIAVPHSGGTKALTLLLILPYTLLSPLVWLVAWVLTCVAFVFKGLQPPRGYSYGFNTIAWQLRYENRWLRSMEERFRAVLLCCDDHCLPRPLSVDIHGTDDSAIAEADREADVIRFVGEALSRHTSRLDGPLVMLGAHPTVKNAQSTSDAIVVFLSEIVESLDTGTVGSIARATVVRSLELDGASRPIGSLVEAAASPEEPRDVDERKPE